MRKTTITQTIVTTQQMQQIENQLFAHQMPIASLMEKVALLSSQKIEQLYPQNKYDKVGIIVGCGHNGGDGLVIARELHLNGYDVYLYAPLANKSKNLTLQHLNYAQFLGLNFVQQIEELQQCNFIIDSLLGFGLQRSIEGRLFQDIEFVNQLSQPVVSIDIPSGINSDTGTVQGIAIKATDTFCLGLWKIGLFQDNAVEYIGNSYLIDIGIPDHVVTEFINPRTAVELITPTKAKAILPLPRRVNTHKYRQGNIALICGSARYAGAALLSGYGANSGGVGMLTMVVPSSVKPLINQNIPMALVIGSNETNTGEMNTIPIHPDDLSKYDVIGFGMGFSREVTSLARQFVGQLLASQNTLLIDADGLNLLAEENVYSLLSQRQGITILTPHEGEFKRLFPDIDLTKNRLQGVQQASREANCIILLKGAKTMICDRGGHTWVINKSTPALARGGNGDVLSGLICALVSQGDYTKYSVADMVALAAWLHQQAGILAVEDVSEMGVDGVTLADYIVKAIKQLTIKQLTINN